MKEIVTVTAKVQSVEEVKTKHRKGLKAFGEEHPESRQIIVSLDRLARQSNGIELMYVTDHIFFAGRNSYRSKSIADKRILRGVVFRSRTRQNTG